MIDSLKLFTSVWVIGGVETGIGSNKVGTYIGRLMGIPTQC